MILIEIRSQLWRGVPKAYTRKIPNVGVQIFNSHWANFCMESLKRKHKSFQKGLIWQKCMLFKFFRDLGFWTFPSPGNTNRFQEAPLPCSQPVSPFLSRKKPKTLQRMIVVVLISMVVMVVIIMMLIAIITC